MVIGSSESTSDILVIEYLDFESEVFLKLSEVRFTFLMIMTRKGNLMPRVSFSLTGQVMKAVVTFVPIISRTEDWIS